MQLITPEYKHLLELKHEQSQGFGSYGHSVAGYVRDCARQIAATSILDYGCGKQKLQQSLGFAIRNYDPGIPGLDAAPEPADLVVCTDVLEHVEPECLDAVLDDLKRCTLHTILLTIDTAPANKHLADGRNAHLIIENPAFWITHLLKRFDMETYQRGNTSIFLVIMRRQGLAQ